MRDKNQSLYFSHDANARNDEKILEMRTEYGYEGYGLFWALIESMHDAKEYKLCHQRIKGISLSLSVDPEKLTKFIEDCINKYSLFNSDEIYFWSESLVRRMKLKEEKSEKARQSILQRWNKIETNEEEIEYDSITNELLSNNESNTRKGKESKGKESKGKESKVKESKEELLSTDVDHPKIHPKAIYDIYLEHNKVLPQLKAYTKDRERKCQARARNPNFLVQFKAAVEKAQMTPFLRGENNTGWQASFDWLVTNDTNVLKVIEGKYDGTSKKPKRNNLGDGKPYPVDFQFTEADADG